MSENLIKLSVTNGKVFVWHGKDWLKLREEHRVVGVLIGCLAHLPRQEIFPGLPVFLFPEEVTLLLECKVAKLVQYSTLCSKPSERIKQRFKTYLEEIQQNQIEYIIEDRKRQITEKIDEIADGKRRKSLGIKTPKKKRKRVCTPLEPQEDIDKEALLKEELDKIKPIPEEHTLVQLFTAHPWRDGEDEEAVSWSFPSSLAEKLRYHTYKDLWERGYYITQGEKFGVDFLIYPGDPIKFHACFLVVCLDNSVQLTGAELVALGRLGTSVRKTVVLASLSPNDNTPLVLYQSLAWSGIT